MTGVTPDGASPRAGRARSEPDPHPRLDSAKVQARRQELDLTPEQLGRRAGVNGAYIEILEAREPRRLLGPVPQRIAWGLRCQLDELVVIGWVKPPPPDLDAPDPPPEWTEDPEPEPEERDSDDGWGYRDPEEKRLWLSHLA